MKCTYNQISATDAILFAEHDLDNDVTVRTYLLHAQVTGVGAASTVDKAVPRVSRRLNRDHFR